MRDALKTTYVAFAVVVLMSACAAHSVGEEDYGLIDDEIGTPESPRDGIFPVDEKGFPLKRNRSGRATVACINGIPDRCRNMVNGVAEFWRRNSRGALDLEYTPGEKGDHVFNVRGSANTSHSLTSYQLDVAAHEMGHRLGLNHASLMWRKRSVDAHRRAGKSAPDFSTVMNGVAKGLRYLNAANYYFMGWLPPDEVVLHDRKEATYELKRVSDFEGDGLSAVIVMPSMWNADNPAMGMPVFISFPPSGECTGPNISQCVVADFLTLGGGTRQIVNWSGEEEFYDDTVAKTGIRIRVLPGGDDKKIKVSVRVDPISL